MIKDYCLFNVDSGDTEAFLRAQCDRFISQSEYGAMSELQSTGEILTALQGTYLSRYISDLKPAMLSCLRRRLTEQLSDELDELECESERPFYAMIQFIRQKYQIDNVILALLAFLERSQQAIAFHPIGYSPLLDQMAVSQDTFSFLLEQLPVAAYFDADALQQIDHLNTLSEVEYLNELELIRCAAFRRFYIALHSFLKRTGGQTYAATRELIEFECDVRCMLIRLDLLGQNIANDDIIKLFPPIGLLYPCGEAAIAQATDYDSLRQAVGEVAEYQAMLDAGESKPLNQAVQESKVQALNDCLVQEFNLGSVWAWVQLREIEIENVVWISECVEQRRSSGDLKNVVFIKK